ncbi:MAG: hypothetical protein ACI9SY_000709 [Candidatus Paceibacteria bacterium]|jgi:hypothetical protein
MIRSGLFIIAFLICLPHFANAQATEDFTIRVFGATDNEAPSTTTVQSIVPVTFSQIDLSWATSTDNFNVFGYVVSRDGIPIATTTSLFYSDTGLMASTTYSYSVRSFDGVPNYSSSSVSAATTTPDIPIIVTPVGSTTAQGTAARVILSSFAVDVDAASANLQLETRRPARIEVRIGETQSYEIGYVSGTRFSRDHAIPVSSLRSNTTYFYEVYGYTASGAQTFLRRGSFTTLSDTPAVPPANVSLFVANAQGQNVALDWQLPTTMPPDARVRVVRSHYGYPTFINDGVVVYEGAGEQAQDLGVLNQYNRVYYTAFIIDPNGRVSSGAIALVSVAGNQTPVGSPNGPTVQPNFETNDQSDQKEGDGMTVTEIISLDMPEPADITIAQLDDLFSMASDTIPLSSDAVFTVAVSAEFIEGNFKTIVATLSDPRGSKKTFSFLLRLNSDRTTYEATIASVQIGGVSDFMVEIYDYDSLVVARYITGIIFTPSETVASSTVEVLWWRLAAAAWYSALLIPFLVVLFLWFIYRHRETQDVA